jgi:hypothetical protein
VEDELEAENDEETLARASAVLHQLQHTWVEERKQAIDDLWQQLEQEYGVTPSRELLDSLDGNGGCRETAGESTTSPSVSERAPDGALELAAADAASAAAEAAADQITKNASKQLESVKALRCRLEAARISDNSPVGAPLDTLPTSRPATAPTPMAAALRRDIDLLRQKEECIHGDTSVAARGSGSVASGICQLLPEEPELAEGLAEWFEEVHVLSGLRGKSSSAGSPKESSKTLSAKLLFTQASPATPNATSSPRSKNGGARIAEECAMDWDAARRGAGAAVGAAATHHSESPPKLVSSCMGKPPAKPGGLTKSGFTCLQPLLVCDGSSNLGPAGLLLNANLGTLAGTRCDTLAGAAELQLDAILSECDEIDRIHESIQKTLSFN